MRGTPACSPRLWLLNLLLVLALEINLNLRGCSGAWYASDQVLGGWL